MKLLQLFLVLTLLLFSGFLLAQNTNESGNTILKTPDTSLNSVDPTRAAIAKSLVVNYTRLLLKGEDVDSIVSLCGVPFAWDRKEIISDMAAFKKKQQEIIEEKGKNRPFILDTVYIRATRKEMLDKIIPIDIYYVIIKFKMTRDDKERSRAALFAVQMSDNPRIIGLSD